MNFSELLIPLKVLAIGIATSMIAVSIIKVCQEVADQSQSRTTQLVVLTLQWIMMLATLGMMAYCGAGACWEMYLGAKKMRYYWLQLSTSEQTSSIISLTLAFVVVTMHSLWRKRRNRKLLQT